MSDPRHIHIKTFGCQMNEYDTERMYRQAKLAGYERTDQPGEADLIVVNTCSVRAKPEHKAVSEIGWMHKRAKGHDGVKIVISGCVAQQMGQDILDQHKWLDGVIGTGAVGRFADLVSRIETGERVADCEISDKSEMGMPDECLDAGESTGITAFVSIMRGCDNFCSYCIVPYVRGPERSRPSSEILKEVRALAGQGVREVTLLGQNVNSYGATLNEGLDFPALLRKVHDIEGLARIRFTTSHPKDLSQGLIEAFDALPKLAGHIHLAVQSGSDDVLNRMHRNYTVQGYMEKVGALRRVRPGIAVTSDMIVGFSGETDKDFTATLDLMKTVRFDNLFSFMYSPRPGTAAAEFPDDVPVDVKKERLEILQTLQKKITLENNRALVGKRMEVLVEKPSRGGPARWQGRTECFRTVHFDDPQAKPGDLILVQVEQGYQNALVGRSVKE